MGKYKNNLNREDFYFISRISGSMSKELLSLSRCLTKPAHRVATQKSGALQNFELEKEHFIKLQKNEILKIQNQSPMNSPIHSPVPSRPASRSRLPKPEVQLNPS